MWIECNNSLINLDYVKRVYIEEDAKRLFQSIDPIWYLKIILTEDSGEYVKTFEDEKEALAQYERIKKVLNISA